MWCLMWDVTRCSSWNVCVQTEQTEREANCNLLYLPVTLCTAILSHRQISAPFIWEKFHREFSTIHILKYSAAWVCWVFLMHFSCPLSVSFFSIGKSEVLKWIKGEMPWFSQSWSAVCVLWPWREVFKVWENIPWWCHQGLSWVRLGNYTFKIETLSYMGVEFEWHRHLTDRKGLTKRLQTCRGHVFRAWLQYVGD